MVAPMRSEECTMIRLELGAYLLGALDGADRIRVAAHVAGCLDCRDESAGLAPLPGLLAQSSKDELDVDGSPRPRGAEDWLAEIARLRRRRRRAVAGALGARAARGSRTGGGR